MASIEGLGNKAFEIYEVHYSMIIILAMGVGLFISPFGVGYYAACAIGQVDPNEGIKPLWGYMGARLLGLVRVAAIPRIRRPHRLGANIIHQLASTLAT